MLRNQDNKTSQNFKQVPYNQLFNMNPDNKDKNYPIKSATFFKNMFVKQNQGIEHIYKSEKQDEMQKNDKFSMSQDQNFQHNKVSKINTNEQTNYLSQFHTSHSSLALLARTKEDIQTIYQGFKQKTQTSSDENRFFFPSRNKMFNETKSIIERGKEKQDINSGFQISSNNQSKDQNVNVNQQNSTLKKSSILIRTQQQNNRSQNLRQVKQDNSEDKETELKTEISNQKIDTYQIKQKFKEAREKKIYSKSQNKLNPVNEFNQITTPYDSFFITPQSNKLIELKNYKTNQSFAKNHSFKDTVQSQSTSISQKRSFNFSHFERFPKLDQNIFDSEIPSILENDKHINHSRSSSQIRKNTRIQRQIEDPSFLFPLKEHSNNNSFQKIFKGLKPIKQVNKQLDNENSLIEHDFVLSMNNELSPKENNTSFNNQENGKSITDQANDFIQKFKKLNPLLTIQEEKLKKLQILKQKEIQLQQFIQKRNFVEAINIMKEFLVQASQEKNLENFVDTIAYLGQLNYFNHDLDNALYSFIQLKNLSEIVGSPQIKMRSLILLGQLFQDEQDYNQALQLYRRAIHYCWYLNDQDTEIDLYDKLGFIYFMKGDIQKAKYFHERSISHQLENPKSENMQQSIYTVSQLFSKNQNFIPNLNQMVLAKLGLLTDQQDQLRFSTKLSAHHQIVILKEDKEINSANHDPSQINPDDKLKQKVIPEGMENVKEYQIIQKILDQKNSFQPIVLKNIQYKDPHSQKIVDKSLLKLTIEEKVQKVKMDIYDDKRLQKKLKEAQVSAMINRQTCNQKFFFNHCTPNRNLLGFKYTFKPNSLKFKKYFQKMENMIINQVY
ncbi:hypothetical protein TTHERM_00494600 (macronuclear) [Tetrahymena thermophila SB210]|uniref:Uncharacterized protein n=1 Tax=Tetrahymena thermophila (strain SB210) TaxID=312017 RepID=I7MHI3_TETTS|nr:hypothetical protein TTHERM_00494600 [Tetrahymena thermophila SB210]EAS02999.2 hypothetical protein TTHERM_00494600 [Tetrahymena thermophila SB210]|eukprot:XP_001023244.2 hypothetical protein TTHERM_00494600 [Tetrahymena thermophila SB210]